MVKEGFISIFYLCICRAIGQELAHVEDILVITGGFYGIGETVGRACAKIKPDYVWHVLPSRDEQVNHWLFA